MRGAVWIGAVAMLFMGAPALAQQKKPEVVAKLEGHRGGVSAVAYSAKGDRLATGSGNGAVRVWDAKTGELLVRVDDNKHNSARVAHVAFSADGRYLCSSSRTLVGVWDLSEIKRLAMRYEDSGTPDAGKLGTVSGDGRHCYHTAMENNAPVLRTYSIGNRTMGTVELPPKLRPAALAPISDAESALVAFYCVTGEKGESAGIALVGLGETRVMAKDVPAPQGKRVSINFSPDSKWLVVCNGSKVAYWRVPGSQVITGDPKSLPGEGHFIAAAGPGNTIAVASAPADGKKVVVAIYDIGGASPKLTSEYASNLERVSTLTFSPNGSLLAVGDDAEGIVQLWAIR